MFQFRPTLEAFEQRLAPAVLGLKIAGYTVSAIVLPPSDGGTTTSTTPTTPTVPPPPPPPAPTPGTGGM